MGEKNERFGRYLILDHLVDGGMAKICRARFLGEQADKIVAIKMVQARYSSDEAFKRMFMDEIKMTFGLLHPNVVQTYDYGMIDAGSGDQLYVAMEYCDGRNLKEYLMKLRTRKFVFPVEISVYIMTQVCQGLHYAHTLTNQLTGEKLSLVHRDISPHNIMLTFDGSVKVIDFGIAKSNTNSEATQAGTIKGKLAYLAPEYLDGKELDPRYDEFAVGITLWEMLCSRKLFKAGNDLAVLKMIQECKIPEPSSINPNVPKELNEIVMKVLSKDRNQRYENLDLLNRALMKFLNSSYPDFNATDLSYFAKDLFKEEIKADREKMFEYGKIDITPYIKDLKNELSGGTSSSKSETSEEGKQKKVKTRQREVELDLDEEISEVRASSELTLKNTQSTEESTTITRKDSIKAEGKIRTRSTIIKPKESEPKGTSRDIIRDIDLRMQGEDKGGISKKIIVAASVAGLLFLGHVSIKEDKVKREVAEIKESDLDSPGDGHEDELVKGEVEGPQRLLTLKGFDRFEQKVYVNGIKTDVDYLKQVKLPLNKLTYVRVQTPNKRHLIYIVKPGTDVRSVEVSKTEEVNYGHLRTSRNCYGGDVHFEMFDEKRSEKMPRFDEGVKMEAGNWTVTIAGLNGPRDISFTIEKDKSVDLCKHVTR